MTDTKLPRLEKDYKKSAEYLNATPKERRAINDRYRDQQADDAREAQEREEDRLQAIFESKQPRLAAKLMADFLAVKAFARRVYLYACDLNKDFRNSVKDYELEVIDAIQEGHYTTFDSEVDDLTSIPSFEKITLVSHVEHREYWNSNSEYRVTLGQGTDKLYSDMSSQLEQAYSYLASAYSSMQSTRESMEAEEKARQARNAKRAEMRKGLSPEEAELVSADE